MQLPVSLRVRLMSPQGFARDVVRPSLTASRCRCMLEVKVVFVLCSALFRCVVAVILEEVFEE